MRPGQRIENSMVESRRHPSRLGVAILASRRQLVGGVVRVSRRCVVVIMAAVAGVGGVVVIPTDVAKNAVIFNQSMSAIQRIENSMVESRRHPSRLGVAILASRRQLVGGVIGVSRCSVVVVVAAVAGVGRVVVIPVVAGSAVGCDGNVRSIENPILVVNREGRRLPIWRCRVAVVAVRWYSQSNMVRVRAGIEIGQVTTLASVRRVRIIASDVAENAVVFN